MSQNYIPPRLPNFGNTCYLNSAMQYILASRTLTQAILKDCYGNNNVHFLAEFLNEQSLQELKSLITNLNALIRQINIFEQEDSFEFLSILLEKLAEPYCNFSFYEEFDFDNESFSFEDYQEYCDKRDNSNITRVEGFYVRHLNECPYCKTSREEYQQEECLLLDLEEIASTITLKEKFYRCFQPKIISIESSIDNILKQRNQNCNKCCGQCDVSETIVTFPKFLNIVVKNAKAIKTKYTEFVLLHNEEEEQKYRATAFVIHHSYLVNHYTCYARRGNQWYHCDDVTVSPVDFPQYCAAVYCGYEIIK